MEVKRVRLLLATVGGLVVFLASLGVLVATEERPFPLLFAAMVTTSIVAFILLLSRRLLFASALVLSLVGAVAWLSHVKRQTMEMHLHSFDMFFHVNVPTLTYLWSAYRSYVVIAAIFFVCSMALAALAWRLDRSRVPRLASITVLLLTAAAAAWTAPRARASMAGDLAVSRMNPNPVMLFYLSWSETYRMLARGDRLTAFEAAARTPLPRLSLTSCDPATKPPHIVLIHQESIYPLSIFPRLGYARSLDRFFLSADNRLHKLRVEIFGAASSLTEFSLFTALSTQSFGYIRPYLQVFLKGRLKETLPQWLASCGYRNLVFFPFDGRFIALESFYKAIGFHEVFDRAAQGLPSWHERDSAYFHKALEGIGKHLDSSKAPLFVYVQTMTAHGPYTSAFAPDEDVPGGAAGTSPELNEYLRRVAIVVKDGENFVRELERRFPDVRFMIVRFGDHQPYATRELFETSPGADSPSLPPSAFVNFFAITGINYRPPTLPDYDVLDVPFLPSVVLDAAGLPLSETQRERKRLMQLCAGRYFDCPHRDEILTFHRRLIDSAILQLE